MDCTRGRQRAGKRRACTHSQSTLPPPPPLAFQLFPADAAEVANRNRRLHLWSSNVDPTKPTILPPSARAHDLYPYSSKVDVVDAVIASSYVPCILGSNTALQYRDRAWIDAAASTSLDYVCDSLQASHGDKCVQVVAVQVGKGSPNATCPSPEQPTTANTGPLYPLLPVDQWTLPLNCSVYHAYEDFKLVFPPLTPDTICPGWCGWGGRWGRNASG